MPSHATQRRPACRHAAAIDLIDRLRSASAARPHLNNEHHQQQQQQQQHSAE